jgi:hypothetical protein
MIRKAEGSYDCPKNDRLRGVKKKILVMEL